MTTKQNLLTQNPITWCPGCSNFMILESVKKTLAKLIDEDKIKQEDFAMVTGIGCHAKMFDYLNISGIYSLHGRVLPTMLGITLGNPKLKVIGFAGDGDTYAEGMGHFIHNCRYNADMTLVVHDNQAFSLTTGQASPTSKLGYKNKANPFGETKQAVNPIKLALSAGAGFIARCNPYNIEETSLILEKAIKHKGFAFVEMVQPCLIFSGQTRLKDLMYKVEDNREVGRAWELADEFDYVNKVGKIGIGVLYETKREILGKKLNNLVNM